MDGRYGASLCEIEIGIVVPSVIYAPVWLADQRGFLRDQGLTVRLRSFGSTDATTAGLRDGAVPVTIGSPEGSIANALIGGDLRLVSGFVNRPPLSMIAQPRYHSMSDLRGAKLGTTSLKEGTCHLMEKMMAAHGMHQPADFQFVMAGAHPQRWEALKAVTLDAAIGTTCAFQLHCRGIAQMREGISESRSMGTLFSLLSFFAALADAYAQCGNIDEGLGVIEEGLAMMRMGETFQPTGNPPHQGKAATGRFGQ